MSYLKKSVKAIVSLIALLSVSLTSGCFLFKDGETIVWDRIDTAAAALEVASQTTTYAVCYKNKDLSPIFKAIGEGLVIMAGDGEVKPEQIEKFITDAITQEKWGTLGNQVANIVDTIFKQYTVFYQKNQDKFKDEVLVFSRLVKAMGEGFIKGSDISVASNKTVGSSANVTPEQKAEAAIIKLKSIETKFYK